MINELIETIRLLKMYTWELKFKEMIIEIRKREIYNLKKIFSYELVTKTISMTSSTIASIIIILVHI